MRAVKVVMLVFLASAINSVGFSARAVGDENACYETSGYARSACIHFATEVHNLALGKCENVQESMEDACEAKAKDEFNAALSECREQFDARQEVCEALSPGPYLPSGIRPFKFVSKDKLVGNLYFPLTPATYTFKSFDSEGNVTENSVVKVTAGTRTILGVACRSVRDIVYEGETQDRKIEDTTDWYAQDSESNVWYFGEVAQNFNEEGILDNLDGSWTAGVEGAKPGIIMFAKPENNIGKTYRQEFLLGEAEDVATVVDFLTKDQMKAVLGYTVPAVFGNGPFLHTREFAALEPGVLEDKYYAPNVGLVLVVAQEDGSREVLIGIKK